MIHLLKQLRKYYLRSIKKKKLDNSIFSHKDNQRRSYMRYEDYCDRISLELHLCLECIVLNFNKYNEKQMFTIP